MPDSYGVSLIRLRTRFPNKNDAVSNRIKDTPYESGITPTGDARQRFSVKFYLVGMLFILFDIEAIFLYPWVVVYRDLNHGHNLFGFVEMLIFVILILSGFFYIWKKGALDWADRKSVV